MLINRLIKPNTALYKNLSYRSKQFDYLMKWDPLRWFGMWCMTLSGFNIIKGSENRYIFWEWGSGTVFIYSVLIIITVWTIVSSRSPKIPKKINNIKSVLYFLIIGLSCLALGSLSSGFTTNYLKYLPYMFYYFAILLVFSINYDSNNQDNRLSNLFFSSILAIMSTLLGFYLDDPIISTVSTVYLPFLIVSIIMPVHIRHLQRAKTYGLFIPAVFLSIRYPWFLIPLLLLFFLLRVYHYFRFNIVFPTFAVDLE